MAKLHHSSHLPIDFDHAVKIYPALEAAANDLDYILQGYQDVDRLFKRHFLELFTGPEDLTPPEDRAWASLIRLRHLATLNLIADPILKLEHNNNRASLTCDMLALVFKL